jgi:hypothetical protein
MNLTDEAYKVRYKLQMVASNYRSQLGEHLFLSVNIGHKGSAVGMLSRYCGGDKQRKRVLAFLFGDNPAIYTEISSKTLSLYQWAALLAWMDSEKVPGVGWMPSAQFYRDIQVVLEYLNLKPEAVDETLLAKANANPDGYTL